MTTSASGGSSTMTSEISNFATSNSNDVTSTSDILSSVNSTLSSNQNYNTASEQMASIENDMARLNNRLQNLSKEANNVFKGDVPQYIVNAYVANRTAEIQNEMSILENRYNAAQSRQQTEWEKTKWEAEFDLKKQELELKKQNAAYDNWEKQQWMALKMAEFNYKYWNGATWTSIAASSLSREEIWSAVDWLIQMYTNWQLGNAQCAAGIQKYYLPQLGVNLGSLSDWSNKQAICNELAWEYSPRKGDIVVMSSSSSPQYWHMGIVVGFDWSDMVYLDWNGSLWADGVGTETPKLRKMSVNSSKIYGYYNPTKAIGSSSQDTLTWHGTTYDLSAYSGWNWMSQAAKETVMGLLTYQIDPDSLPKTWETWVYKTEVLNAAATIWRNAGWTDKKAKSAAKYIDGWNKALNQWGVGSANSTAASLLWELSEQFKDFNAYDIQTVNNMLNKMSVELWGSWVMATYADLNVAANELAKALKGNAAATEQEKRDMQNLLSWKMSNAQAQEVFKHFAKDLVDKNASEAQRFKQVTGYKPESIYLEEVTDRMNNDLWIDMARYYEYTPTGGWGVYGGKSGGSTSIDNPVAYILTA